MGDQNRGGDADEQPEGGSGGMPDGADLESGADDMEDESGAGYGNNAGEQGGSGR